MAIRLKSFTYAMQGIAVLIKGEHNAWLHVLATLIVLVLGFVFDVARLDWVCLFLAIALVWVAEGLNTAVEYLADAVSLEYVENIKHAKDIAAGAVLISSLFAVLIAVFVFYPHVFSV